MTTYLHNRRRSGPLTDRQLQILTRVAEGLTHDEIASQLDIAPGMVAQDMGVARVKTGVHNTAELVALYSRSRAYTAAAEFLRSSVILEPVDEAEVHVNHVLEGFAAQFDQMAKGLLP